MGLLVEVGCSGRVWRGMVLMLLTPILMKLLMMSMGTGKMMVELFSAEMLVKV